MTSQAIIVTGMHRSGTSLVMSFLENLGVYCGSENELLASSEENPRGYWERPEILEFNDAVLHLLSSSWSDLALNGSFRSLPQAVQLRLNQDIRELITSIFEGHSLWGIKDPRISLLLPLWQNVMPDAKYIVCVRNPIETSFSLANRFTEYHIRFEKGMELWKRYNEKLIADLTTDNVLFVHYDALFADIDSELERIIKFVYSESSEIEKLVEKAKSDYLPEGRHYAFSKLSVNTFTQDHELSKLYDQLCGECGDVYQATVEPLTESQLEKELSHLQALIKLQKVAYQYYTFANEYSSDSVSPSEYDETIEESQNIISSLKKALKQRELSEQKKEEKILHLDQIRKEMLGRNEQLKRSKQQLIETEHQLTAENQSLRTDNKDLFHENTQLNEKTKELVERVTGLMEEITQLEEEIRLLTDDRKAIIEELDSVREELRNTYLEKSDVESELNAIKRDNITIQEELIHFQSMSGLLDAQLQGILHSRTWTTLEIIRHHVGKVAPFLLKSPYDGKKVEEIYLTEPVSLAPKLSIYPESDGQNGAKKVLYIYPADKSLFASCMYRVHNIVNYLSVSEGFFVSSKTADEVLQNPDVCYQFDILVFFRLPLDVQIENIVNHARQRNIICCYDIDDYVFDLSVFQYVDPLLRFDHESLHQYFDGIHRYRAMLLKCDYFIASTPFLAAQAEQLGIKAFVIPNGLNQQQEQIAAKVFSKQTSSEKQEWVRIGYLSGTNTHNKDFAIVKDALVRILSEFKDVKLSIRGILTLPEDFDLYKSQIEFLPFVPFEKLLEKTDVLDILIAPLEINPYTEAKSELKYFEPALLEKPVVASPTDVFLKAITDGDNGFIASTPQDWYEKLKRLVTDPELRSAVGKKAREHALAHYGFEAQSATANEVFTAIWRDYFKRSSVLDLQHLKIDWIVPAPASGSGGHRVIFEICEHLQASGHQVTIHFLHDPRFSTADRLREFITSHFFEMQSKIQLGIQGLSVCDALVATSWNSAATVYNHRKLAKGAFYFVQDFEPYFFPMSSDYIAAYGTYSMGLKHITIGDWLRQKLEAEFSATARSFPFPIDHQLYFPGDRQVQRKKIQLAFFARNTMARRCYPLGVEALKVLKLKYPSIEIILFGSNEIDPADFPYPHTNLGVITPQQLADLYRESIVGLSFSTTNPSIVPFEMMACGLPVVDLDFNQNDIHYGGLENVTLAQPNPNGIAEAVIGLIENEEKWQRKRENGIKFAGALPARKESARLFEEILVNYLLEDMK